VKLNGSTGRLRPMKELPGKTKKVIHSADG
jgi:hypothetical protein